jgi:hypothetical protein
MVNSTIVNYLRENSNKYELEDLKKEVLRKGYSEDDFNEVVTLLCLNQQATTERVKQLPAPTGIKKDTKKKGYNWGAFFLIVIALFMIGIMVMNYAGFDFFGWNLFKL